MRLNNFKYILLVALMTTCVFHTSRATALDFGEIGLGTQVVVVPGETGTATGVGFDLRTRFLWILGVAFSATNIESSEAVWGVAAYRASLMIHAVNTEHFCLYLSPGFSGDTFGDSFNPVGDSTWYRLGGGFEFRFLGGLSVGLDVHWTVPGEHQVEDYLTENGDELFVQYVEGLGSTGEIPTSIDDLSPAELLGELPLDRFEWTVGVRYYF